MSFMGVYDKVLCFSFFFARSFCNTCNTVCQQSYFFNTNNIYRKSTSSTPCMLFCKAIYIISVPIMKKSLLVCRLLSPQELVVIKCALVCDGNNFRDISVIKWHGES